MPIVCAGAQRVAAGPWTSEYERVFIDPTGSSDAVLLTAREDAELQDRAATAGATADLTKPFAYADLLACVARLTEAR